MHISDIQDRAKMLIGTVEGIKPEVAGKNLRFTARQYQDPKNSFPDISESEGQETVLEVVKHFGADLVILDNLSTLALSIEDENAASEFNEIIGLLMQFKQMNTACVLVHHTNKSGEAYRGSSKLATTFEVMLNLKGLEGIESREGTAFTIDWTKYRNKWDESMGQRKVWLGNDEKVTSVGIVKSLKKM